MVLLLIVVALVVEAVGLEDVVGLFLVIFSFSNSGGFNRVPEGPPESVVPVGGFMHACEGELVIKSTNAKIPHFNAPIYLENKQQIGKLDEIFGPINSVYFTVKPDQGVKAESFDKSAQFFINPEKLLPLERFLPRPAGRGGLFYCFVCTYVAAVPKRGGFNRGGTFNRGGGFNRGGAINRGGGFSRGSSGGSGFRGNRGGSPRGGFRGK